MKLSIKIIVVSFFCISIIQSCYKDNSSDLEQLTPVLKVAGVNESYTLNKDMDTLVINPEFSDADPKGFSFVWTILKKDRQPQDPKPILDTIGHDANLKYIIKAKPGSYILTLHAKYNRNGVTKMYNYLLNSNTPYMSGWYILKEENGKSDLDFFYQGGKVENWIARNQNGKALEGKALKVFHMPAIKTSMTSTDLFSVLVAVTDQDVAMYKLEDGSKVMDYETMFFTKPATKKVQNVIRTPAERLILINDHKAYSYYVGTKFGDAPESKYKIGDISAAGSACLLFDEFKKTLFLFEPPSGFIDIIDDWKSLKNTNSDLIFMEGFRGSRNTAILILKNRTDNSGKIIDLNMGFNMWNSKTGFIKKEILLAADNPLLSADKIAGNYSDETLYYAKGNQLFSVNYDNSVHKLQATYEPGAIITNIQHVRFPAVVAPDYSKIFVSTYLNGKYKVWVHSVNSVGALEVKSSPDFEGSGKASTFVYVKEGQGSFVYR